MISHVELLNCPIDYPGQAQHYYSHIVVVTLVVELNEKAVEEIRFVGPGRIEYHSNGSSNFDHKHSLEVLLSNYILIGAGSISQVDLVGQMVQNEDSID